MKSSSTRRKTAFVPWLAALIIGATVHAGWLIHELREPRPAGARAIEVAVEIRPALNPEVRPQLQPSLRARHTPAPARPRSLAPRCRHASVPSLQPLHDDERGLLQPIYADEEDERDLDMWIERVDRYTYAIDRRVLQRVALADYDGELLARLGVVARTLGYAEPIELRNIRAGTPLFVLGLRTGDRVHAIETHGGEAIERVEVAIERRGRPIELIYRLI